jgi:hypothetical protein
MSVHASPDFFHTCAFTYRDGRRCREPRSPDHPTLCLSHARKEAVFLGQEAVAGGICNELKRNYTHRLRSQLDPQPATSSPKPPKPSRTSPRSWPKPSLSLNTNSPNPSAR